MVKIPRNNRFFQEKRYDAYVLWIEKTSNRRGYIAEIYKLDEIGRKCCLTIPEGYDGKGWMKFHNMLTFRDITMERRTVERKLLETSKENLRNKTENLKEARNLSYADILKSRGDKAYSTEKSSTTSITEAETSGAAIIREVQMEETFNWDKLIVLSRRCFHDDWIKIMEQLRTSNESIDAFNPFHADKALITVWDTDQASLLCKNRDWVTVGQFTVKFEKWSKKEHSTPKLIPSYGGWLRFRGIPLSSWNIQTFRKIGEAYGGFIDVGSKTWNKLDLIEAQIKIQENYCGFVPANIQIEDEEGNTFIVSTVTRANGNGLSVDTQRSMELSPEKRLGIPTSQIQNQKVSIFKITSLNRQHKNQKGCQSRPTKATQIRRKVTKEEKGKVY